MIIIPNRFYQTSIWKKAKARHGFVANAHGGTILSEKLQKSTETEIIQEGLLGKTRRERLKSALYLSLKKRKTFFWKKLEIFEKNFSFGKCRVVPKNVKGGTLFDL